jgi:hypothetical protein
VWLPGNNSYPNSVLRPSDDLELQAFDPLWLSAANATPSTYRQSAQPPLSFDVDRIPTVAGNYEVLSVNAGAGLLTTAPTLLGIPDDWAWIIKWGALGDLLSRESLAKDPLRASYCDQRYQEGLGLLNSASALLSLRLAGSPLHIDSVRNGDDYDQSWQLAPAARPTSIYVAGLNLIGFGPAPDSAYSVEATVVRNAPVPSSPSDYIQLGRDDYSAVLDYAQHLAAFKQGGDEFVVTVPLYQAFLKRAALYNSKLSALGSFQKSIYETSQLEQERNPVYGILKPQGDQG